MYYVSPCCAVALILPWMALEAPRLYAAIVDDTLVLQPVLLLGNAMAAFALNLAVYLLIGKTSALTMNLAGVQTCISSLLYTIRTARESGSPSFVQKLLPESGLLCF